MQDNRFDGIPLILETINPDIWAEEIALAAGAADRRSGLNPDTKKGRQIGPFLLRLYYAAFSASAAGASGRFSTA